MPSPTVGRVAALGTATIVFLGAMGIAQLRYASGLGAFDLNGERNVPASFTALLLVAGSLVTFAVGAGQPARNAWLWRALGGVLLFGALDELGELHERLEFHLGVDWQLLYLPLLALAGGVWTAAALRMRHIGAGLAPFLAGTACLGLSQVLEALEYDSRDRRVEHFDEMMVTEELLEMTGGLLIVLAMLSVRRRLHRAGAGDGGRSIGASS